MIGEASLVELRPIGLPRQTLRKIFKNQLKKGGNFLSKNEFEVHARAPRSSPFILPAIFTVDLHEDGGSGDIPGHLVQAGRLQQRATGTQPVRANVKQRGDVPGQEYFSYLRRRLDESDD